MRHRIFQMFKKKYFEYTLEGFLLFNDMFIKEIDHKSYGAPDNFLFNEVYTTIPKTYPIFPFPGTKRSASRRQYASSWSA